MSLAWLGHKNLWIFAEGKKLSEWKLLLFSSGCVTEVSELVLF